MTEEHAGFASALARLEEIAAQVKDKDTPLERCLDLLEEGGRIAARCTELLDHTEWRNAVEGDEADGAPEAPEETDEAPEDGEGLSDEG